MATIPVNKIFGEYIYAKGRVNKLSSPGGTVIGTVDNGKLIGTVYSYVLYNGKVYWMINGIYAGQQPFFVEHNPNTLNLPNKQAILNEIAREAEKQKLDDKGILQYNIDKYLPWIIGGGIAFIALPTIIGTKHKLAGMKKNKNGLLIIGAVLAFYFLTRKKYKAGTPVIETIDEGFVNDYQTASVPATKPVIIEDYFGNQATVPTSEAVLTSVNSGSGNRGGGGYIDYVGPFKVDYSEPQNMIAGYKQKGNLGAFKTC